MLDGVIRELPQVVNELMENDKMVQDYERLSSDLLEWIKQRIALLNDRQFQVSIPLVSYNKSISILRKPRGSLLFTTLLPCIPLQNSLSGVQQQLTEFNNYRTQEKPPK